MTSNIQFDMSKAAIYSAREGVYKRAILVKAPTGFKSLLPVSWNMDCNYEELPVVGSYYWIYELNGEFNGYAVPQNEFEATHTKLDGIENGYIKNPVAAYRYTGPDAVIDTIKADGTVERKDASVTEGDWLVMWPEGSVGVRPNEGKTSFPELVDVGKPMPIPAGWPNS